MTTMFRSNPPMLSFAYMSLSSLEVR
jgi:hypothetical protein